MDYLQAIDISASGLKLQRLRLEVAAQNLANMQSVHAESGQPYLPRTVVAQPSTARVAASFGTVIDGMAGGGVAARVVTDATAKPRLVHEPAHPNADHNGMVRYPGVDHLQQMLTITEALRAYEANIAAMHAARSMAGRALEIGGNQ